jgi:ABC-type glycerol-3-phosphate transport system substrate-binding protein
MRTSSTLTKIACIAVFVAFTASFAACSASGSQGGPAAENGAANTLAEELQGEITVTCFDTTRYSKYLLKAAELFEKEHPGTKINIAFFSQMPEYVETATGQSRLVFKDTEPMEVIDYIYKVNTQLMSGLGPDVLAMDVLPAYKYADASFLEDLRDYMDADESFDPSLYRSSILEALRYKGGQYVMPLDFGYLFVEFDPEVVDASTAAKLREKDTFLWHELVDLISEQYEADDSDARAFSFTEGASEAFGMFLFPTYYKTFLDMENRKANFNDGRFADMLNGLEALRLKGYYRPSFASLEELMEDIMYSERRYYYHFSIDMTIRLMFKPRDDDDAGRHADASRFAGLLTNDEGEVVVRNYQSYGINAHSKNKALAWAFIKSLLGEEIQQSYDLVGMPVNNAAFLENAKVDLTMLPNYVVVEGGGYGVDGYEDVTDEKTLQAYERYIEFQNDKIRYLNFFPILDRIITDMVNTETALFFDGTKSAEEVAAALQSRVQLYLDE